MKTASSFLSLLAAAFLLTSCDQPSETKPPSASSPVEQTASVATLTAAPNPVPAGSGPGTTTITWNGGGNAQAVVYVAIDGGEEKLFAEGFEGASEAPWIQEGMAYEFRLYADKERTRLLTRVAVSRAK